MDPIEYHLMDEAETTMWWYRALHARLAEALAPVHGRVLDAGCGTGGFLRILRTARPDLELLGLEWADAAAHRARAKSAALVARGSVNAMPFADASLDAVVTADVLCHDAVHPPAALTEFYRVLRPGGRLVINMPSYAWLASAHDRRVHNARRVTAASMQNWLATAGFTQVRTRFWNSLLLPLMIVQRKLLARGDSASDVATFPPWLDATLHGITRLEHTMPFTLPFGGSVLSIASRPVLEPSA
jgi:ubiquinone/menaquinone biosynthesis C-methylase UbiE